MSASGKAFAIQPHDVDPLTPWLMPFLERFATETTLTTPADVLEQAKDGRAQLWSYHDGAQFRGLVATRIHATQAGRICNFWVCVGVDTDELLDTMLGEIEPWARSQGCHVMEVVGRMGWARKLASRGFERTAVVLEKRLAEVH
jgi:hypothetical protein